MFLLSDEAITWTSVMDYSDPSVVQVAKLVLIHVSVFCNPYGLSRALINEAGGTLQQSKAKAILCM